MIKSHVHRKKPRGRPMPERTARANATCPADLEIATIGRPRPEGGLARA